MLNMKSFSLRALGLLVTNMAIFDEQEGFVPNHSHIACQGRLSDFPVFAQGRGNASMIS